MSASLRALAWATWAMVPASMALASGSNASAVLRVVINPEARVSVEVVGPVPPITCGERVSLPMEVINESLGTPVLRVTVLSKGARIVGPALAPLSGAERETREIAIQIDARHPVDITLEFDAGPGTDDLGGRSRTHLYANCVARSRGRT